MPRFSANLSTMFREFSLRDRLSAAADAGFRCIEMQFPYEENLEDLAGDIHRLGLEISVLNVPVGDFPSGGEGNAAIPGLEADFRTGVTQAKRFADRLRPINVNVLAGAPAPGRNREDCLETLVENLRFAADQFAEIGVRVVVEAINDVDRPGFLLPTADAVAEIIRRADHPNLAFEFDLYHMAMMNIPIVDAFRKHAGIIGHIQFADAPGRHEPGTGTIDFASAFSAIDASEYDGWVAAEYFPKGQTVEGLSWMAEFA